MTRFARRIVSSPSRAVVDRARRDAADAPKVAGSLEQASSSAADTSCRSAAATTATRRDTLERRQGSREGLADRATSSDGAEPWGTTYPVNLRLYMQKLTEAQWLQTAKSLQTRPPMPWFAVHADDRCGPARASTAYVRHLGPAGSGSAGVRAAGQGAAAAVRRSFPVRRRSKVAPRAATLQAASCSSAARSVLASSIAIVIGPTPPGTGVIHAARSWPPRNRRRRRACRPALRLMPTSMTIAPGLIQSPCTNYGLPTAATSDVRLAHDARQIARRRMADRHRAARHQQLERHRPADDVRLPDDHRVLADEILAGLREQAHAAVRRARTQHRALQHQPADVVRMEAVDVLARIDALGHALRIDLLRQRQLHQDAVDRGIGVERVDQRQQLGFRRVAGRSCENERMPTASVVCACCARRPATPHSRRPARRRARAAACPPRRAPRPRSRDVRGQPRGARLAVDDACAHRSVGSRCKAANLTGFRSAASPCARQRRQRRIGIDRDRMRHARQQRKVVVRVAVEPALAKVVEPLPALRRATPRGARPCPRACSASPRPCRCSGRRSSRARSRSGARSRARRRSARSGSGWSPSSAPSGRRRGDAGRPARAPLPGSPAGSCAPDSRRARRSSCGGSRPSSVDR